MKYNPLSAWDWFLSERLDQFTEERYQELLTKIRQGDMESRDYVVRSFIDYVQSLILRKLKGSAIPSGEKNTIMLDAMGYLNNLIDEYNPYYPLTEEELKTKDIEKLRPIPFTKYIGAKMHSVILKLFDEQFKKLKRLESIESMQAEDTGEAIRYVPELTSELEESKIMDLIYKIEQSPKMLYQPQYLKYLTLIIKHTIDEPELKLTPEEKMAVILVSGVKAEDENPITQKPYGQAINATNDLAYRLGEALNKPPFSRTTAFKLYRRGFRKIDNYIYTHREDIARLLRNLLFEEE